MIFNSFRRKNSQEKLREHFGSFQDEFSEDQKKAILISLYLIANSDGHFHRKEREFFHQIGLVLGYDLSGDYEDDFLKLGSRDRLMALLNSLDASQKDWYIITAIGMLQSDGAMLEVELDYLNAFFSQMGITEERIENTIKKSQLMMEAFL